MEGGRGRQQDRGYYGGGGNDRSRSDRGYHGGNRGGRYEGGYKGGDRGRGDRGRGERGGFSDKPMSSTVAPGQQVPLVVNNFKLKFQGNKSDIYVYNIDFGPNIAPHEGRKQMDALRSIKDNLNSMFDKWIPFQCRLFTTQKLEDDMFSMTANAGGQNHDIQFSYKLHIDLDQKQTDETRDYMSGVLSYFNSVMKQALRQQDFMQIGRFPKFYLRADVQQVQGERLSAWPGYEVVTQNAVQGLFLNVDCCTRFVNQTSIMDIVKEKLRSGYREDQIIKEYDSSNTNVPRVTVIAMHNSRSYQVDGMLMGRDLDNVDLSFNHKATKDGQKSLGNTNMREYFKEIYNIKLSDKQPLLFVNKTRNGKDERIYLPTQCCFEASLPPNFTKDQRKMRMLQEYKLVTAQKRLERIDRMIAMFQNDKTLLDWGVEVNGKMTEIAGKKLKPPRILDQNRSVEFNQFQTRKVQIKQPLKFGKQEWAVIYHEKDFDNVTEFLKQVVRAQSSLGMKLVVDPNDDQAEVLYVQVPYDYDGYKAKSWIDTIDADIKYVQRCKQAIVFVQREDSKPEIKRYLDSKGVVSQFVTKFLLDRKLTGQRPVLSIYTNILLQINAKSQNDLYRLEISNKISNLNPMIVGIDVVNKGRLSVVGLAATYSKFLTQHHSKVVYQDLYKERCRPGAQNSITKDQQEDMITADRTKILQDFMKESFNVYTQRNNGQQPGLIVMYRNGIGGPTLQEKCLKQEIGQIQQAVRNFAPNYSPQILYVFINTKVTTRLFEKVNGHHVNPGPGTLVDQIIVENDSSKLFDFYMVANINPTSATALPVHFMVAENTTDLSKTEIEDFTHQQTYGYYGWAGPCKLPGTVMYAKKIAAYADENKFAEKTKTPNVNLSDSMHYI